ncbi:hypothetical protein RUM43_012287 [Polyplax serrata]|uniref:Uncharacterized protein n=1 Tax=Polyplax serrata TaxID=468196 RepID=A0AAN8NWZ9_POLSC
MGLQDKSCDYDATLKFHVAPRVMALGDEPVGQSKVVDVGQARRCRRTSGGRWANLTWAHSDIFAGIGSFTFQSDGLTISMDNLIIVIDSLQLVKL